MSTIYFFDLDGTLADTDPDIRASWRVTLDELGLVCPNFERDFIAGPPIEEMLAKLLPDQYTDELAARLRARFGFHYDHDGFPKTREYPGVLDAVRRLKAAGHRVFIATNKRYAGASAMARHFGWDQIFEDVFAGDRFQDDPAIGKMKKPALLKFLLARLGVAPEDCIMVGDTNNDFAAARANGIPSIAVSWGYGTDEERALADRIVTSPEEI